MQNKKSLRNIVALSLIPGLGAHKIRQFTRNAEHIEKVFSYSKRKLRTFENIGEASALGILTFDGWNEVDNILKKTEKAGAKIVTICDPEYPELLKQIYSPPVLFWMKGNIEALNMPAVAVIGTRNPSPYGKKQATRLCSELATEGLCIISGLAYGIDGIAHQATLDAGGTTVAVLGSGIDNIYPHKHVPIAKEIIRSGGAIISEFPLGAKPDAGNFPVRNRIVSGMSLGVLVIESGMQGGSMITAELGLDQNREIFAVPHNLDNLSGSGGNFLIKRGAAKLVQVVDDILEELSITRHEENKVQETDWPKKQKWRDLELDELSKSICESLEVKSMQIDSLSDQLNVPTSQLLVALLQLEMADVVQQLAGKIFELK